jgi:hypothetical protein
MRPVQLPARWWNSFPPTDFMAHLNDLQNRNSAWAAPYYSAVFQTIGTTGTIIPIGDFRRGLPSATTFTTLGEEQLTFTWSEAPNAFDQVLDLDNPTSYQGLFPIVDFNGSDEEADSPDATYWSRVGVAFSIGVWLNPDTVSTLMTIMSKWDETTSAEAREWRMDLQANGTMDFTKHDESVASSQESDRPSSTALTVNVWNFVVVTDDGNDTVSSINWYLNGAVDNGSATDGTSYVAMENLGQELNLGFNTGTSGTNRFYNGSMAGGPLGPFYTQTELNADAILRLYEVGRAGLGLT